MVIDTGKICEEFREPLKRFIARRIKDKFDAEDVLQNVICKIYNSIGHLKDKSKLEAWVYRITRNEIIDYYRKRKVVELTGIPEDMEADGLDAGTDTTFSEVASCLKFMISELPNKYKQAVILTEFAGLTQKELGEKLGLSPSGAKSRVQRARIKLKEMLLECCHFEFDRLGNILDYRHKENTCPYCTRKQNRVPGLSSSSMKA